MRNRVITVIVLSVVLISALAVLARQPYFDIFIDTYPNVKDTDIDVCICHTNPFGDSPRNAYGEDFARHNYDFKEIEDMDSDGDGWRNIDEINVLTHPGDPTDNPNTQDKTPPIIQIEKPANGEVIEGGDFVIEGTASDNIRVVNIIVEIPGLPDRSLQIIDGKWSTKVSMKKGAVLIITATAFDLSGNHASVSVQVTVVFDDVTPPIVEFIFPQDGATLDSFPFLVKGRTIEGDNSTELVEYSLDTGKSWDPAQGTKEWSFPVIVAPEGDLEIWIRATDTAGFTSRPYTITVKIVLPDVLPPNITYPTSGMVIKFSTVTVSGTAKYPAKSVEVRLDDGGWQIAMVKDDFWMIELSGYEEGEHTVEARAVDILNRQSNTSSITFSFEPRESAPPEITIESPVQDSEHEIGFLIEVKGSASDESGVSIIEVMVDDGEWMFAVGKESWVSRSVSFTEAGRHTIKVRATDINGNMSEPISVEIIVLPALEFKFGDPSVDNTGNLGVTVSWNRDISIDPTISMKGATKDFDVEEIDEKEWLLKSTLGAGLTTVTISGIHLGKASSAIEVEYVVKVNLTIDSDNMIVNNNVIKIPEPAVIVEGRLYIPFRSLGEAFNADVLWDGDTKTATYVLGNNSYDMTLNSVIARINGREVTMNNAPLIIHDRLMIPVRAVSLVLGAEVNYDSDSRTATITLP